MTQEKLVQKDNTSTFQENWSKEKRISTFLYRYYRSIICREISRFSYYYDMLIEWCPLPKSTGFIFKNIKKKSGYVIWDKSEDYLPLKDTNKTQLVLLNGHLNYWGDIQRELEELKAKITRNTRIIAITYSHYAKWLFIILNKLKLRTEGLPRNYISLNSINHIVKLSGYEMIAFRPLVFFPLKLFIVGSVLNTILRHIPIIKNLCLVGLVILRPIIPEKKRKSLSLIIPARNEKGNIRPFFEKLSLLKNYDVEIVFVEGHSQDGTWEEIKRNISEYRGPIKMALYKQPGKGKKDAVEYGLSKVNNDLILILDSDLTVPMNQIRKFYDAYCSGLADFINGDRLIYPMEKDAMRFLNWVGNVFFAKALSLCLNQKIGDALCGTKLFPRVFKEPIKEWSRDFNKFDPFGDFELLFAVSELFLGTIDVPVCYVSRKYGTTNIQRFFNGWQLFKMVLSFIWLRLFPR